MRRRRIPGCTIRRTLPSSPSPSPPLPRHRRRRRPPRPSRRRRGRTVPTPPAAPIPAAPSWSPPDDTPNWDTWRSVPSRSFPVPSIRSRRRNRRGNPWGRIPPCNKRGSPLSYPPRWGNIYPPECRGRPYPRPIGGGRRPPRPSTTSARRARRDSPTARIRSCADRPCWSPPPERRIAPRDFSHLPRSRGIVRGIARGPRSWRGEGAPGRDSRALRSLHPPVCRRRRDWCLPPPHPHSRAESRPPRRRSGTSGIDACPRRSTPIRRRMRRWY
mmetsp:Transcript_29822/g.88530  ORF Transcript_29822/g.88530 Transcript_29822/m.88530 type:complete len:272 (-) Transcript_29822:90-905(-)